MHLWDVDWCDLVTRVKCRCCTEVPQSHPDLVPREALLMGPNAVRRPHGPSRCLVDLEIRVVMFKRRGNGRENTNHMGQGGRNRLNQWHYSLSRCLCDTPRMAQHHSRNNARGRDRGRVTQVCGALHSQKISKSYLRHAQIEHHVFNVQLSPRSQIVTESVTKSSHSPPPQSPPHSRPPPSLFSGQDEKVSHFGLPSRHPRTSLPKSESLASPLPFSCPVFPRPLARRSPSPCSPCSPSPRTPGLVLHLPHPLLVSFTLSLAPCGSPKTQKTHSCPQYPRWD